MKTLLVALAFFSFALPAYAAVAPEIDGSLTMQIVALAGGLAMLFKRKR